MNAKVFITHVSSHNPRETLVTGIHMFVSHTCRGLRHDRPVTPVPTVDATVKGDLTLHTSARSIEIAAGLWLGRTVMVIGGDMEDVGGTRLWVPRDWDGECSYKHGCVKPRARRTARREVHTVLHAIRISPNDGVEHRVVRVGV